MQKRQIGIVGNKLMLMSAPPPCAPSVDAY